MSPGVSTDFKELVRTRTDIVGLIGESVALTPRHGGQEYVALCPFHDDHNPSFHVYPDRQSYRCWVCNEGGDCFSWTMKVENFGFREALEMLAQRVHLEVPRAHQSGSTDGSSKKNDLHAILAWAEREFHRCLLGAPAAEKARRYLQVDRGLTPETINAFSLGYHPLDWQWLMDRARGLYTPEQLLSARLVRERRDQSGLRDDFVDRVMFPIHDIRGRTVAFGARVLPDADDAKGPKYLNSPESILFTKSRLLFGLDVAKRAIQESGTAVVVEGYTDCITAFQYGISNVVGTLGTALTEQHVRGLKRFAQRVVLVYDGDRAGQQAAERSLSKFLAYDTDLRILTLPDGLDPAEFLARQGAETFREQVAAAADALDYKLRTEISRFGLETVRSREQVMDHVLELVSEASRLGGTTREDAILGQLARRLMLPEQTVRHRLAGLRSSRSARTGAGVRFSDRMDTPEPAGDGLFDHELSKDEKLECELFEILFVAPAVFQRVRRDIGPEDFGNPVLRRLFEVCGELADRDREPTIEQVMLTVEDPELKRAAVWIDEQARIKDVAELLLHHNVIGTGEVAEAPLLRQVLGDLKWRRERQLHERAQGDLAGRMEVPMGLDSDSKAMLRQAANYHQKRVTKKPLI